MNVFWPFWLSGNSSLEEVNQYLNERRLEEETNPLTLDSASLVKAFRERIMSIPVVGDFAKRFVFLRNQESNSYHYKEPKKEWPEHKAYMIF